MILVERIHNYARYRHDQGILGCCHLPIALTVVSGLEEGEISSPEYPIDLLTHMLNCGSSLQLIM